MDLKSKFNGIIGSVKNKTDAVTLTAKKKMAVSEQKNEIERQKRSLDYACAQMGKRAFALRGENLLQDAEFTDLLKQADEIDGKIKAAETRLQETEADFDRQITAANAAAQASASAVSSSAGEAGTCPNCGAKNDADSKFCVSCGTPLASNGAASSPAVEPASGACPNCGTQNAADSKFCVSCGSKLRG